MAQSHTCGSPEDREACHGLEAVITPSNLPGEIHNAGLQHFNGLPVQEHWSLSDKGVRGGVKRGWKGKYRVRKKTCGKHNKVKFCPILSKGWEEIGVGKKSGMDIKEKWEGGWGKMESRGLCVMS